jgi:hypothetical protein
MSLELTKRFALNRGQWNFFTSKQREVAITSGLGGGKSMVLQLLTLITALRFPNALHCYASLSYGNMTDSSIPEFIDLMDACGIVFEPIKSQHLFYVGPQRARVIFRSQEIYQKMRSVQLGSLFCDELAYWDERAYKTFLGRLRDKRGPLIVRAASSPNGLNFFHKIFIEDVENNPELQEVRKLIMTASTDNRHLPEMYLQMLESTYDSRLIKQERDGLFINLGGGLAYYAFSRERNVKACPIVNGRPLYICMDFNVNPMTAVACQYDGQRTRVVHEFWQENSYTEQMGKVIAAFFGGTRGITIIPDSTGANRKTSSTLTDHAILRELGFEVPKVHNPLRRDRFNCVNGRLERGLIEIDPSCVKVIRDMEAFVEADEKKTPMLGHISDAMGYGEWFHFPFDIRGLNEMKKKSGSILL